MNGRQDLNEPLLSSTKKEPNSPPYLPVAWQNRLNLWNDSPASMTDEKIECEASSSSSSYNALPEKKKQTQSWLSCASSFFWCCFPLTETKPDADNSPRDEFSYPK